MNADPSIRDQTYAFFLMEAPELLQTIEQELLNLREDYSIAKVHTLMRMTHTLKGASASVGLETVKTVAHSLENVFKSLYNPDVVIDLELEALLFQGYECLRLPLMAEFTGSAINEAEIFDRAAAVFTQLQSRLGDCFDEEAQIPTSAELGFDVTQSIFESGVSKRLEQLATTVAQAEGLDSSDSSNGSDSSAGTIASSLRTQAEVFVGLAESLNLPGFGSIAQAALQSLDANPDQALTIAQLALADFQQGQAAVLAGDRACGGTVSPALQALVVPTQPVAAEVAAETLETPSLEDIFSSLTAEVSQWPALEESSELPPEGWALEAQPLEQLLDPSWLDPTQPDSTQADESWLDPTQLDSTQSNQIEADQIQADQIQQDSTWPEQSWPDQTWPDQSWPDQTPAPSLSSFEPQVGEGPESLETLLSDLEPGFQPPPPPTAAPQEASFSPSPAAQPQEASAPAQSVRVELERLERLNYLAGELLTNQNRQALGNEQSQSSVQALLQQLQRHQQTLSQLRDWADRLVTKPQRQLVKTLAGAQQAPFYRFDSLEMDPYSEFHVLLQSAWEETVQLEEAAEGIDFHVQQSSQVLDQQRRLLTNTQDDLVAARMLPLGTIFNRFPRLLQQLAAVHDKPVELHLHGSEVLVDKAIAEKLYDPLLHLVRNAFDHGIEPRQVRLQHNKPVAGQIHIHAYHQGRKTIIEVSDDGQGINPEQIRRRALEVNWLAAEELDHLSNEQVSTLLFEPGFSTAAQVSDLSGRGIGLDVVRSQLQSLQGSVTVRSQLQQGTTFSLQIPLSLTISRLFVCQAGGAVYAFTADALEQIVMPEAEQIQLWQGQRVLDWYKGENEHPVPLHQLANLLPYSSPLADQTQGPALYTSRETLLPKPLLLVQSGIHSLGLEVDQILGEQDLVIRSVSTALIAPPSYVSGCSVLADGRLALVLDGAALIHYVLEQAAVAAPSQAPGQLVQLPGQLPGQLVSQLAGSPEASPSAPAPASSASAALPPGQLAQPPLLKELPKAPANGRPTILVVDDSITLRQSLALTLQKANYLIVQARDGQEALEQLRRHAVNLMICDVEMPRLNGFELLSYRAQDPDLSQIPVIMLTSRSSNRHRQMALELGANAYLTKPYLEQGLLETVTNTLNYDHHGLVSR